MGVRGGAGTFADTVDARPNQNVIAITAITTAKTGTSPATYITQVVVIDTETGREVLN